MEHLIEELRPQVQGFREGILNGSSSKNKCFMVAFPLEGFLNAVGYSCKLVSGTIDIDKFSEYEHFWLELAHGVIIDPTADQFQDPDGHDMPEVYIGEKPKWYLTGKHS